MLKDSHPRAFCAFCLLAFAAPAVAQTRITLSDLLARFTQLDWLYSPPAAGEHVQCFTADFSVSPCNAPDGWCEVAGMAGPGSMTRLWLSSPTGGLRIEVDGRRVFEGKTAKFFSGTVAPFQSPFVYTLGESDGSSCYFPIPFAKSLRVLALSSTAKYAVECTRYADNTPVEAFRGTLSGDAEKMFESARKGLLDGLSDPQIDGSGRIISVAGEHSLAPGRLSVESVDGAGIVRAIYVAQTKRADPVDLYALHRCAIRVVVDGQPQPVIEAPLIDFFASGFRRERINTLVAGTNRAVEVPLPDRGRGQDEFLYFLLPMPFANGLRVELLNAGREPVDLLLYVRVSRTAPPADSLRLFASFRREDPVRGDQFEMLSTRGPVRLVGTLLMADSEDDSSWQHGKLQLQVGAANRLQPVCDVGVASWLGLSSAQVRAQTGLHAVSLAGAYGKRSGVRWLLNDSMPIGPAATLRLQLPEAQSPKPWIGGLVWWYGRPGDRSNSTRLQSSDLEVRPLKIPQAFEIEGRIRELSDAPVTRVSDEAARRVEFSGGAAVALEAGREYELALAYPRAEVVELRLRVHPRRTFGTITVTLPDKTTREIAFQRGAGSVYEVGNAQFKAGENTLRMKCSEPVVVDCWIASSKQAN